MWCLCYTHSVKWLNDLKLCAFLYMTASINILLQESFLSGILCKIRLACLLELVWALALQASGYTSSRQEFFTGHFSQDPTISYWCDYQIMPDDIKTKPAAAIHALPLHREPIHLHVCHQLTFSCLLKGNDNMGLKQDLLALRKHLLNLGLLLSFSSFSNFLAFSTKESRKKNYTDIDGRPLLLLSWFCLEIKLGNCLSWQAFLEEPLDVPKVITENHFTGLCILSQGNATGPECLRSTVLWSHNRNSHEDLHGCLHTWWHFSLYSNCQSGQHTPLLWTPLNCTSKQQWQHIAEGSGYYSGLTVEVFSEVHCRHLSSPCPVASHFKSLWL